MQDKLRRDINSKILAETSREGKLQCEDMLLEVLRGSPKGKVLPGREPALGNQNKTYAKKVS